MAIYVKTHTRSGRVVAGHTRAERTFRALGRSERRVQKRLKKMLQDKLARMNAVNFAHGDNRSQSRARKQAAALRSRIAAIRY